ncbi:VWA domain-containing protein [Paenibacillus flagellatus]|uniref:VWFA domain-containing protein n=1 Tax=Paenibacillus flagellatus TaxID=2211139 RepID=A0A2V5JY88_9BACL|nr:VWA domain-containing protein [Paenibacillus flagellatus]PYI50234.1 hypothetical protein DLM86_30340 [Paenibacillus flagellatus]
MKQILLITDGCSNVGLSPVVAAAHARREGIVVNVVGVVDDGELGERGATEIAEIARAGGGMSRIVAPGALTETVQMMTRKTVVQTIQQAVQHELRQLIGPTAALEKLSPDRRGPVVRVIDELSETAPLRVALLIDTSASMRPKLRAVGEACRDLLASLRARKGKSEMSVLHFPGNTEADVLAGWTSDLAKAGDLFYKLNMKGTTPTGPAIMKAAGHVLGTAMPEEATEAPGAWRDTGRTSRTSSGDGIWSDYIV